MIFGSSWDRFWGPSQLQKLVFCQRHPSKITKTATTKNISFWTSFWVPFLAVFNCFFGSLAITFLVLIYVFVFEGFWIICGRPRESGMPLLHTNNLEDQRKFLGT